MLHAGAVRQRALADVEVDERDLLAARQQCLRHVDDGEGLAGALTERGGHQHAGVVPLRLRHHVDVGDHHAEGVARERLHSLALLLMSLGAAEEGLAGVEVGIEGHLAEERHGDGILDVAPAAHARVHEGSEQEDHGRHEEPGDAAKHHHAVALGRDLRHAAVGRVDDARVVVSHRLGQRVLLAAVEQEEVERLLDLLLALDREDLALLAGDGGDAAFGGALVAAGVAALHLDRHDDVVDAA